MPKSLDLENRTSRPGTQLLLGLLEYLNWIIMSLSIIDCQQLPTPSKMVSHPAILSVYEVCLCTIPEFPQNINGLDTTGGIGENDTITRDHIEYARKVVTAIRGYFASSPCDLDQKHEAMLIVEMYQVAVESAYSNATVVHNCAPMACQNVIKELKDKIQKIECRMARLCLLEAKVAKAQASADNAQILSRNSHLQYPALYFPLKKTIPDSGLQLAQAVCPGNVNANILAARVTHSIGSLPQNFDEKISMYSEEQILMMIIFYNKNFGIGAADSLPTSVGNIIDNYVHGEWRLVRNRSTEWNDGYPIGSRGPLEFSLARLRMEAPLSTERPLDRNSWKERQNSGLKKQRNAWPVPVHAFEDTNRLSKDFSFRTDSSVQLRAKWQKHQQSMWGKTCTRKAEVVATGEVIILITAPGAVTSNDVTVASTSTNVIASTGATSGRAIDAVAFTANAATSDAVASASTTTARTNVVESAVAASTTTSDVIASTTNTTAASDSVTAASIATASKKATSTNVVESTIATSSTVSDVMASAATSSTVTSPSTATASKKATSTKVVGSANATSGTVSDIMASTANAATSNAITSASTTTAEAAITPTGDVTIDVITPNTQNTATIDVVTPVANTDTKEVLARLFELMIKMNAEQGMHIQQLMKVFGGVE
ncbi:hypothetical protein F5146DRAFT_1005600 [Armillaria mellea]|nr:hypothetical protein F5146DRAFT_1005600 [Armillaria mellea]